MRIFGSSLLENNWVTGGGCKGKQDQEELDWQERSAQVVLHFWMSATVCQKRTACWHQDTQETESTMLWPTTSGLQAVATETLAVRVQGCQSVSFRFDWMWDSSLCWLNVVHQNVTVCAVCDLFCECTVTGRNVWTACVYTIGVSSLFSVLFKPSKHWCAAFSGPPLCAVGYVYFNPILWGVFTM